MTPSAKRPAHRIATSGPARSGPAAPVHGTAERIAKVISRAGVASRRAAEEMIAAGRVAVNDMVIDSPARTVTAADRITVDGKPLSAPGPARLWLYHKPAGLVTSARDEKGRPTVFDALPPDLPRVMSIGRLDLTSEGLLLLTNDGGLKRRLELPATGWLRRYRVRIKGAASEAALERLRNGITVEDIRYQPMTVTFDRQQGANAWLTIGLREGKNREIRRALAALGVTVNRLIRVSYGPFQLGNLAAGAVEEVRRTVLRDQLGEKGPPDDATGPAPRGGTARRGKPAGPAATAAAGKSPRGAAPGKTAGGAGARARPGTATPASANAPATGGTTGHATGQMTGRTTGHMTGADVPPGGKRPGPPRRGGDTGGKPGQGSGGKPRQGSGGRPGGKTPSRKP